MRLTLAMLFVAAQTSPNFSGRWILAPDPPGPGRGGSTTGVGSGWASDISVTQDAAALTIEHVRYSRYDMQAPVKFVYRLDGSESKNVVNIGRGPQEQVARAVWDGNKLVITTRHTFKPSRDGTPITSDTVHVLSFESPAVLVVETTHGAVMGGQASTSKSVYKKN